MNQAEFSELVAEGRFSPFIITLMDGFSIAIGSEERGHLLVGRNMIVLLDRIGDIIHIPYRSIAHIQEPK